MSDKLENLKTKIKPLFYELDSTGKEKLSTKGYILLGIIGIILIMTLGSMIFKKSNKHEIQKDTELQEKVDNYSNQMISNQKSFDKPNPDQPTNQNTITASSAPNPLLAKYQTNNTQNNTQQQQQIYTYNGNSGPNNNTTGNSNNSQQPPIAEDFVIIYDNDEEMRKPQSSNPSNNTQQTNTYNTAYNSNINQPQNTYTPPPNPYANQSTAQTFSNPNYVPTPKYLDNGTVIAVTLKNTIRSGTPISTALAINEAPVLSEDGQQVIPPGSKFEGQAQFTQGKVNITFTKITLPSGNEKPLMGYAMNNNGYIGLTATDTNIFSRTANSIIGILGSAYLQSQATVQPGQTIYNGAQVIQTQTVPTFGNILAQKMGNAAEQQLNQQTQNNQTVYELSAGTQMYIYITQKFTN